MNLLIYNALKTPDGTTLCSRHRHDFIEHIDANGKTYMVDGGLDYARRSAHEDQIELSLFDDAPHSVQRRKLRWGTYGISGKDPLSFKKIKNMDTNHLTAVLKGCTPSTIIRNCMRKELEKRKQKKI